MQDFKERGYVVIRASGSRGPFDVVAIKELCPALFIQCKVSREEAVAKRLMDSFRHNPPLIPCASYRQRLMVKVVGEGIRAIEL